MNTDLVLIFGPRVKYNPDIIDLLFSSNYFMIILLIYLYLKMIFLDHLGYKKDDPKLIPLCFVNLFFCLDCKGGLL